MLGRALAAPYGEIMPKVLTLGRGPAILSASKLRVLSASKLRVLDPKNPPTRFARQNVYKHVVV